MRQRSSCGARVIQGCLTRRGSLGPRRGMPRVRLLGLALAAVLAAAVAAQQPAANDEFQRHMRAGEALQNQDKYDDAIKEFRAALKLSPNNSMAHLWLARALGRTEEAEKAPAARAGVWAPPMAAWSGAGDLEIPLTLYCTGAAAFFIEAWRGESRRAAVLSGLLLGGGLWTKPTAGALALGMVLAVEPWVLDLPTPRLGLFNFEHMVAVRSDGAENLTPAS